MVLCPLQVGHTGLGAIKRKEIAPNGPAGKWIPQIPSVLDSSGLEVLVRRKGMLPPGGTARVLVHFRFFRHVALINRQRKESPS